MNVKLAEEAGFCFGVKNALDKIKNLEHKENVYVLGKLIHNSQVIDELKEEGVKFVENIDDATEGTLVISAHGVSDDVLEKAKGKNLDLVDTTCPLVRNVHNITKDLEKEGYKIIIFGDKAHTEVRGIEGNLENPIIISSIDELDSIGEGKYALVSQTTQDVVKFSEVSERLKDRIKDLVVKDTICSATKARQENAKSLAKDVELMIVIGGYNSANTARLRDICNEIVETKHIEKVSELDEGWFKGKSRIGVTAGASTPESVINEVVDRIKNF
ncbi:MAG: 4-hydroxy-3-methylbut-2-enyl diphosphate reductase [Nanoarchaeota archaeon]|nr:4-hydroxy-3-methylbut-2-enyl diphosphate reductase [Nanoarchaeota archaeon]